MHRVLEFVGPLRCFPAKPFRSASYLAEIASPKTEAGMAGEAGSSRGSADRVSSKSPARPTSTSRHIGGSRTGGLVRGATTTKNPRRGERGGSPASPGRHPQHPSTERFAVIPGGFASGRSHDAFAPGGGGRKHRLRGATARGKGDPGEGGGDMERGAAPLPAFDELSRWKVTRGSVPKMVRLAGEVSPGRLGANNRLFAASNPQTNG